MQLTACVRRTKQLDGMGQCIRMHPKQRRKSGGPCLQPGTGRPSVSSPEARHRSSIDLIMRQGTRSTRRDCCWWANSRLGLPRVVCCSASFSLYTPQQAPLSTSPGPQATTGACFLASTCTAEGACVSNPHAAAVAVQACSTTGCPIACNLRALPDARSACRRQGADLRSAGQGCPRGWGAGGRI